MRKQLGATLSRVRPCTDVRAQATAARTAAWTFSRRESQRVRLT